ncbi:MAG: molecular chaperone HscC [Robiginitomaculum sp.]|nr:MAG: molecular chaperone HscC [Robiginitomaculum sp.]
MSIVGIDLGTTNSLISVFTDDGPKLIPNALGDYLTPSAVGLSDKGQVLVGQAAKDRLVTHPALTQARFKRYMGTNWSQKLGRKHYRAEDLSALVLGSLKRDAENYLGETVERAIISVPAYFNDTQRKATMAAGQIAGLKVERLINEPTAAALAYGLNDKDRESTFLVVDLGGGTFDVSILEMFDGVMEVRASAGDAFLGGEDFTDIVTKYFAEKLSPKQASKLDKMSAKKAAMLRDLADQAKAKLSSEHEVSFKFIDDKSVEQTLSLTRAKFEEISEGLLKKLRHPIQRAVMDAGLRAENIDQVVLVGGATRMPVVRSLIARMFKTFPVHNLNPDHVIAMGAAVQAGLVSRHKALDDVVMTDVCPFTLGTELSIEVAKGHHEDGHFQPIIERNTVIPVSRSVVNYTMQKGQTSIDLRIFQGEAPRVDNNVYLGQVNIPIPKNMKKHEAVDIRFTYDVSGVLEVLVKVLSTEKTNRLIIEGNPGALSKSEIDARFKALDKLKIHPRDETVNAAFMARLAKSYENHLGDARKDIQYLIGVFEAALARQNKHEISEARDEIEPHLQAYEDRSIF